MDCTQAFLQDWGPRQRIIYIVFEKGGNRGDRELERYPFRVRDRASFRCATPVFEIVLADRNFNFPSLWLADLTVHPIGRRVINPLRPNRAWGIVKPERCRSPVE